MRHWIIPLIAIGLAFFVGQYYGTLHTKAEYLDQKIEEANDIATQLESMFEAEAKMRREAWIKSELERQREYAEFWIDKTSPITLMLMQAVEVCRWGALSKYYDQEPIAKEPEYEEGKTR